MSIAAFFSTISDIALVAAYLKAVRGIDRIESATCYSDLHFLYLFAREGRGSGLIVEIGAFKGKSTCALALGNRRRGDGLVSIDPHVEGTEREYRANLSRFTRGGGVHPLIMTSEAAAAGFDAFCASKGLDPRIRLMFIDGCHEYEAVRKDILLWKDRVIDGGVIAFHDYSWDSVRKALDGLVKGNPDFVIEATVGRTLFVSKGTSVNAFLFEKMRLFDKTKRLLLRRGSWEYGAT